MEDTAKIKDYAIDAGKILEEHKGQDTIVLYVGSMCSWTDYFVISTSNSETHARGLMRALEEFLDTRNLTIYNSWRNQQASKWILFDCGEFVVHIMDKESRDFYELERLWFSSEMLFQSSSKSS